MRWLQETRIVIPFLFSLIFIFSFLLYRNLTSRSGGNSSPTIGVITFKNKTVLRKFNDAVVWETIESRSEVKNRDTIRTEGLSDAVLTLNDGTKINISENSMILLDISDKNINLNFAYGSFEAERKDGVDSALTMNIKAGEQVVEVGKGEVKLDKTKSELNIKVESGEAKVSTKGVSETVSKDQLARVSETGTVNVETPVFSLVTPEDRKTILSESPSNSVTFQVEGVSSQNSNSYNAILEVSNFPDFKKIIKSEKLNVGRKQGVFEPGSYYWRVRYQKKGESIFRSTEVSRFRILFDPPLRLLQPKNGDVLPEPADGLVRFVWNENDLIKNYTIEISSEGSSKTTRVTKQTNGTSLAVEGLGEGEYSVRLVGSSSLPNGEDKNSLPIRFTIKKALEVNSLDLSEPKDDKVYLEDQAKLGFFLCLALKQSSNKFQD